MPGQAQDPNIFSLECCNANYSIVDGYRYGCAKRKDRGVTACNNEMKVHRSVVEKRLLGAIKADLFNEEAIELFKTETTRLLHSVKQQQQPAAGKFMSNKPG